MTSTVSGSNTHTIALVVEDALVLEAKAVASADVSELLLPDGLVV